MWLGSILGKQLSFCPDFGDCSGKELSGLRLIYSHLSARCPWSQLSPDDQMVVAAIKIQNDDD